MTRLSCWAQSGADAKRHLGSVILYKLEATSSFSPAINLGISMEVGQLVRRPLLFPAWGEDRWFSREQAHRRWEGGRTPPPGNSQEIHEILWVKLGSTGEVLQGDKGDLEQEMHSWLTLPIRRCKGEGEVILDPNPP